MILSGSISGVKVVFNHLENLAVKCISQDRGTPGQQ